MRKGYVPGIRLFRRLIAGLLAICLLFAGCSDKDSVPHGILPIDKMSTVMWDMIQADQYAAILAKDSVHVDRKLEHLRLYEQVLQLHEVSREKFKKSYQYYLDHPEVNAILYDSLVAQGNRLRTESYSHPGYIPATPSTPVVTPPPALNTPLHGRPGIPVLRPFIKPDTTHGKRVKPDTTHGKRTKPDSTHLKKHS